MAEDKVEMDIDKVLLWLKIIRANMKDFPEVGSDKKIKALDYAIDSVNTDKAYNLMHENIEVYTKEEVLEMFSKIENAFKDRYPTNYAGEPEFGGRICHYSLNEVCKILNSFKPEENKEIR